MNQLFEKRRERGVAILVGLTDYDEVLDKADRNKACDTMVDRGSSVSEKNHTKLIIKHTNSQK
jgi:hypothetical protein